MRVAIASPSSVRLVRGPVRPQAGAGPFNGWGPRLPL